MQDWRGKMTAEEKKEFERQRYRKHKAYYDKYRQEHRDERIRYCRQYNEQHREEMRVLYKKYREEHPKPNTRTSEQWVAHNHAEKLPLTELCELCPEDDQRQSSQRHHPDYSYPDLFVSCCNSCHGFVHQGVVCLE